MDIRVEAVSPVKQRIHIQVDAERVQSGRRNMLNEVRRHAQIRGFRPGKAPMSMIERHYGEHVMEELKGDLLQEALDKAIEDHHLKLVARPEIESSAFDPEGAFGAVAVVEVSPEITPKDYLGVTVKRRRPAVNEALIDRRLAQLAKSRAQLVPIEDDRPAQKGDVAEIDYEGKVDGVAFEGGKGENHLLELGSGSFIPGFEDQIIGARAGQTLDVNVTFPEEYGASHLAGKAAVFTVTVKSLKTRQEPAIDDEFAKDLGEYQSLDELRAYERGLLMKDAERRAKDHDRGELVTALLASNEFDVPDTMVAKQLESMKERARYSLMYSGLQGEGAEELLRGYDERMRPEAVKEVKAVLLLDAIAKAEGIVCSDEDLQAHYEDRAKAYRQSAAELAAYYQKNDMVHGLRHQIVEDKAVDFLLDRADAEWVDAPESEVGPDSDDADE